MNFDNTTFYDKASGEYSNRRYKSGTNSYIQFFFKRRLSLTIDILQKYLSGRNNLSLLEVGCADGIVIETIDSKYSNNFTKYIGTDISPEMIKVASEKNKNNKINYYIKNSNEQGGFDFVLAIGFLSPGIFDREFDYIKKFLKKDGIAIVSMASRDSIYTKLKLKDQEYSKDYWNHNQYMEFLQKDFDVLCTKPCGLFIPKLWVLPVLARIAQPICESVFKFIIPNLFHEKLYVLRRKA